MRVPAGVRQRLEEALAGADGGAVAGLVQVAARGHNADRALVALDEVLSIAATSTQARQRLGPDVTLALVRGVADRRTPAPAGEAGILGVEQAARAAVAVATMPEASYQQLQSLLARAGAGQGAHARADPDVERALILKAVGARAERLRESRSDEAAIANGQATTSQPERALPVIARFADSIRGEERQALIQSTTLLDLDLENTSASDPLGTSNVDERGDNDGLYQRFQMACAPTMAQLAKGEADPVFARNVNADANDASADSATAKQQWAVLTKTRFFDAKDSEVQLAPWQLESFRSTGALPAGVRAERGDSTLRQATQRRAEVMRLAFAAEVPAPQREALALYLVGGALSADALRSAASALNLVRRANAGAPSDGDLELMLKNPPRAEVGMRGDSALNDITRLATGITYRFRTVPWDAGRWGRFEAAHLAELTARLERGQSVALRVAAAVEAGGHFLLASDVRGQAPDQRLLISDPSSGRTTWISESELLDPKGDWLQREFAISLTQVVGYYTE
jgi:hypothetical protein